MAPHLDLRGVDAIHPQLRGIHRRVAGIVVQQKFNRTGQRNARRIFRSQPAFQRCMARIRDTAIFVIRAIHQHRFIHARRMVRCKLNRHRRAHRFAQHAEFLYVQRVGNDNHAARVIADGGLRFDVIGTP